MQTGSRGRHGRLQEHAEREVVSSMAMGLLTQTVDQVHGDGTVTIEGRRLVNFGSCSYLGLFQHPSLKQAAIEAIDRFGVSFSSSRLYAALPFYRELEERLTTIVGGPAIAALSTTLGHLSALPAIVGEHDVVLVDRQAHASLHLTSRALSSRVPVHPLPHASIEALEERIERYSRTHDRVWYIADGVYSAFGDIGPNAAVMDLLDRHPSFHAYIDDAHGFGWAGRFGRGVALGDRDIHPRLVMALSLSKAFGAGGGAIAAGSNEVAEQIMARGGPLMFGGPIQTAELAAGVAAADLLLSDELDELQARLRHQMQLVATTARSLELPMASWDQTPIWFVTVGPGDGARALARAILDEGFWVNVSGFPVVPVGRAGIRFTHTLAQTDDQIVALLQAIRRHLPESDDHMVIDLTELEAH